MTEHRRTRIRRLEVHGYRSLRKVVLEKLPPIAVFYGPNGSGKSNILRAVQLLMRALQAVPNGATRANPARFDRTEANKSLGLRSEDFTAGQLPEIRLEMEVELGSRVRSMLGLGEDDPTLNVLSLAATFQDSGDKTIRFWLDRADVDGRFEVIRGLAPVPNSAANQRNALLAKVNELDRRLGTILVQIAKHPTQVSFKTQRGSVAAELAGLRAQMPVLERSLESDNLISERLRNQLLRGALLQISDAYRVPGGELDPTERLFAAFLSEDPLEQEAARRLGRRLASAGLFGDSSTVIDLLPVDAKTFGEKQIRFSHPTHGKLSLRNLGSGEQQVVILLGERVITPHPIAFIEEPEAHLHVKLMARLADILRQSVFGDDTPDVDQLWIATHHRHFALADSFYDVSLDSSGWTVVTLRPRDEVAKHAYEPKPYWDTLALLVQGGKLSRNAVILPDEVPPKTVGDVLDAIEQGGPLAMRFVDAATEAFVRSLADEEEPDS